MYIYIYVQVECNVSLVVIANISDCNVLIINCRSSHSGDAIRVMSVGVDHLRERLAHCKIIVIPQLVAILIFLHIFFSCFFPENRHVAGVGMVLQRLSEQKTAYRPMLLKSWNTKPLIVYMYPLVI